MLPIGFFLFLGIILGKYDKYPTPKMAARAATEGTIWTWMHKRDSMPTGSIQYDALTRRIDSAQSTLDSSGNTH